MDAWRRARAWMPDRGELDASRGPRALPPVRPPPAAYVGGATQTMAAGGLTIATQRRDGSRHGCRDRRRGVSGRGLRPSGSQCQGTRAREKHGACLRLDAEGRARAIVHACRRERAGCERTPFSSDDRCIRIAIFAVRSASDASKGRERAAALGRPDRERPPTPETRGRPPPAAAPPRSGGCGLLTKRGAADSPERWGHGGPQRVGSGLKPDDAGAERASRMRASVEAEPPSTSCRQTARVRTTRTPAVAALQ